MQDNVCNALGVFALFPNLFAFIRSNVATFWTGSMSLQGQNVGVIYKLLAKF